MEAGTREKQAVAQPLHALSSALTVHLSHTNSVRRAPPKAQTFTVTVASVLPARSLQQVCLCDWEVGRGLRLTRASSYTRKLVHARQSVSDSATEILKASTRMSAIEKGRRRVVSSGVVKERDVLDARDQIHVSCIHVLIGLPIS